MLMREGFRFSRLVKFPTVALAFVFGKPKPKTLEWASYVVCMHLFIEGEHKGYRDFLVKKNLALLCDLRFFSLSYFHTFLLRKIGFVVAF